MKKRRRRFIEGESNHIYQRTVDGVILFYDKEDFLLFYMIVSVTVKKYNVRVLQMCLMIDHVHMLAESESLEVLADFVRDYTSIFAKEYNLSVGRSGRLFAKSFGSAPKKGEKKTNLKHARKMKSEGVAEDIISRVTGLSPEKISKL